MKSGFIVPRVAHLRVPTFAGQVSTFATSAGNLSQLDRGIGVVANPLVPRVTTEGFRLSKLIGWSAHADPAAR